MISRIGKALMILALCLSLGLHWLALQSVAWTTMLVSNARHVSLGEAVAETFDGAHPCDICHAVAAGKKSEKNKELLPTAPKSDLICTTRSLTLQPPFVPYAYARVIFRFSERWSSPPVPPPRSLPG